MRQRHTTIHEPSNLASLRDQVLAVLRTVDAFEAKRLAVAIRETTNRHRDGFIKHGTMRIHLRSLWGTVDAKGLRADVEALLTKGGAR